MSLGIAHRATDHQPLQVYALRLQLIFGSCSLCCCCYKRLFAKESLAERTCLQNQLLRFRFTPEELIFATVVKVTLLAGLWLRNVISPNTW